MKVRVDASSAPDAAADVSGAPVVESPGTRRPRRPNLRRTVRTLESIRGVGVGITILAVLGVLYTLFIARTFLVPIIYAILLNLLLSPVVRVLGRLRMPAIAAAAVIVLALVGVLATGAYELAGPVQRWTDSAPATLEKLRGRVHNVLRPLQRVRETAQQVEQQTSGDTATAASKVVVQQGPSLSSKIVGRTRALLAGLLEVIILLFFLLAAGDLFLQKLIRVLPNISDKKKAVLIARQTSSSISTYLLTLSAVNLVEGILVTIAMWLLGMPTPALWGALVALFEFIPYLGAVALIVLLGIAGLTTFSSLGHALLVPATYMVINGLQAYVVSPIVLGHRLALNPVAVIVGLSFWFWIWGVPGAFLAVPLLAALKILCDNSETLSAVGEFLGGRHEPRSAGASAPAPAR